MHIPEGYTEDTVLAAIDKSLKGLASNFSFGYFDEEDMYQEGFLLCVEKLEGFDPENKQGCSLSSFLHVCLRNSFINMQRKKLYRKTPPCSSCPFQNKATLSQCDKFEDYEECPKWSGWTKRNLAKRSLMESCDASKLTYTGDNEDVCDKLSNDEIIQYVNDNIPMALRADYNRFLDGARLNKARRDAVQEAVYQIVMEFTNGEIETWQGE